MPKPGKTIPDRTRKPKKSAHRRKVAQPPGSAPLRAEHPTISKTKSLTTGFPPEHEAAYVAQRVRALVDKGCIKHVQQFTLDGSSPLQSDTYHQGHQPPSPAEKKHAITTLEVVPDDPNPKLSVIASATVHGDEPVAAASALYLLEWLKFPETIPPNITIAKGCTLRQALERIRKEVYVQVIPVGNPVGLFSPTAHERKIPGKRTHLVHGHRWMRCGDPNRWCDREQDAPNSPELVALRNALAACVTRTQTHGRGKAAVAAYDLHGGFGRDGVFCLPPRSDKKQHRRMVRVLKELRQNGGVPLLAKRGSPEDRCGDGVFITDPPGTVKAFMATKMLEAGASQPSVATIEAPQHSPQNASVDGHYTAATWEALVMVALIIGRLDALKPKKPNQKSTRSKRKTKTKTKTKTKVKKSMGGLKPPPRSRKRSPQAKSQPPKISQGLT